MNKSPIKYICTECGHKLMENEMLVAVNPFAPEYEIAGCPNCLCVETLNKACDYNDCWDEATCGFNDNGEYKFVCGKHWKSSSNLH